MVSMSDSSKNRPCSRGSEHGTAPRSHALTGAFVVAAAFGVLFWYGDEQISALSQLARISFETVSIGSETTLADTAALAVSTLIAVLTPILLTVFVVTIAVLVFQHRPRFSFGFRARQGRHARRVRPRALLSPRWISLLFFSVALLAATSFLVRWHLESIATLPRLTLDRSALGAARITLDAARWLLLLLAAIGLADFFLLRNESVRSKSDSQRLFGPNNTRRWQKRRR